MKSAIGVAQVYLIISMSLGSGGGVRVRAEFWEGEPERDVGGADVLKDTLYERYGLHSQNPYDQCKTLA